MDPLETKQLLLARLNQAFDAYIDGLYQVACRPGCPSCCTRHVTVTTLEAYGVYDHLMKHEPMGIDPLTSVGSTGFRPSYTTNDLASACFEHRELPEESPDPDVSSCLLLKEDRCSVYDARPFACRSFLSLKHCQLHGQAEIPSALASVIGACQQIIEHVDIRGYFGNLTDMLILLAADENAVTYSGYKHIASTGMPATRPLPGFLIPPEDREEVNAFLSRLFSSKIDGRMFHEAVSGLRPLPSNKR